MGQKELTVAARGAHRQASRPAAAGPIKHGLRTAREATTADPERSIDQTIRVQRLEIFKSLIVVGFVPFAVDALHEVRAFDVCHLARLFSAIPSIDLG